MADVPLANQYSGIARNEVERAGIRINQSTTKTMSDQKKCDVGNAQFIIAALLQYRIHTNRVDKFFELDLAPLPWHSGITSPTSSVS